MRGHLQCENGKGLIGLIHAKNVGFEYFRRDSDGEVIEVIPALKDVSMQVQPGDFVAVLGANGSGKSTFAKHLCALLTPGEGTILVAGMDICRFARQQGWCSKIRTISWLPVL